MPSKTTTPEKPYNVYRERCPGCKEGTDYATTVKNGVIEGTCDCGHKRWFNKENGRELEFQDGPELTWKCPECSVEYPTSSAMPIPEETKCLDCHAKDKPKE